MTVALLTAAGIGIRMKQEVPKQFLHIYDKPVLVYTLERFQQNPQIDFIVVVTLPSWIDFVSAYARQFGITKLRWVVPGGATGQESIQNGLSAIAAECPLDTIVMIHDGNRPMVDNSIIADSLSVFREKGSAVAVIPCTEVAFVSRRSLKYRVKNFGELRPRTHSHLRSCCGRVSRQMLMVSRGWWLCVN